MFLTKKDRLFIIQQVDRVVDAINGMNLQQEGTEVITISTWVQVADSHNNHFYSYMVQFPDKEPLISQGMANKGPVISEIWALSTALQMVQMMPEATKYGIDLQPSKRLLVDCLSDKQPLRQMAWNDLDNQQKEKLETLDRMLRDYFKVRKVTQLTEGSVKSRLKQQFTKWQQVQHSE